MKAQKVTVEFSTPRFKAQNPGEDPEVEQQDSKTVKRQRPGQKHDAVVLNPMEQTLQM